MKNIITILVLILFFCGCSVKHQSAEDKNSFLQKEAKSIISLQKQIENLSSSIDKNEAKNIAEEAHFYPKVLAKKYNLSYPPQFHNFLINIGAKKRGFCYHWTEDLILYLKSKNYKTIELRWGVYEKGTMFEHNCVVITPKNGNFYDGIILDPWRKSSKLFWSKIKEDEEYTWIENKNRTKIHGTAK